MAGAPMTWLRSIDSPAAPFASSTRVSSCVRFLGELESSRLEVNVSSVTLSPCPATRVRFERGTPPIRVPGHLLNAKDPGATLQHPARILDADVSVFAVVQVVG